MSRGHSSYSCTKEKRCPAMCEGDHISKYKGCPKYKSLFNHRKSTYSVLMSNILKLSPLPQKPPTLLSPILIILHYQRIPRTIKIFPNLFQNFLQKLIPSFYFLQSYNTSNPFHS